MKKFKDILAGESIYMVDPLKGEMRATKVLESFQHPKSLTKKVWVIKFLKLSNVETITEEKLEIAKDYGSDVTVTMYVEAEADMVIANLTPKNPVPFITVVSTDENRLKSWMERPNKEVTDLKKKLRHLR